MTRLTRKCALHDCERTVWAREMCLMHYSRWRAHGDPTVVLTKQSARGAPQAFLCAVPETGEGCLTWPFSTNGAGYGQVNVGGRHQLASRVVCERFHGPPPSQTHMAAHSCGKGHEGCIAPWHLSWKTPAENSADRYQHGTVGFGEAAPFVKLTSAEVGQIVLLLGSTSQYEIAAKFGVSQGAISKIARGDTWTHVTGIRRAA